MNDRSDGAPRLPAACGAARPALGLLLPVGLALAWEIMVWLGLSNGRLVPPPTNLFATIAELARSGELTRHIVATLTRVAAGFGLGVVAGTLLGAVSGYWGLARRLLDPTVQALRAIPSIAWVPLFILWLGIFETSKIALIAVGVFFPVYLGVMGAILSVDRKIVEVGRTFRLVGPAMIRRILLPAVLPAYVVALRVGLGLGWMFVVAAEFMGASEGLGYLLIDGQQLGKPAQILAAIVIFAILGKTTDWLIEIAHRAAVALAGRLRPPKRSGLMLVLDRLGKIYPNGVNALERFSADVRLGEIVAIIGGSGCGKSTLLRAIAGLDRADVRHGDARRHLDLGAACENRHHLPGAAAAALAQRRRQYRLWAVGTACGYSPRESRARARRGSVLPTRPMRGRASCPAGRRSASRSRVRWCRSQRCCCWTSRSRRWMHSPGADLQDHLLDLWADTRPTLVLVTHDVDEAVVLADRVLVMRPRPGRLFEEIKVNLARPRDRNSPLFDNFKRRVLTALDRSLDRSVPDADAEIDGWRGDVVVTSALPTH